MPEDIESAMGGVHGKDQYDDSFNLEESVKAINCATKDAISSLKAPSVVNIHRRGTEPMSRDRLSDEIQESAANAVPSSLEQRPLRHGTFPVDDDSPSKELPERHQREIRTENAQLENFLVRHFESDLFSLRVQKTLSARIRNILRSLSFNPKLVKKRAEDEPQVIIELSIASLNRMRMRSLQMKLTDRIMRMHYFKQVPDDWESLLEQYISATRDNDFIHTCVERGLHDPFLIKSERHVDAAILNAALMDIPGKDREKELLEYTVHGKKKFNLVPPVEKDPIAIGGTRTKMTQRRKTKAFLQRIFISVLGGAFLIGPMWLMIVVNKQYVSLISTSVFVFVWGVVAARMLEDHMEVLSTTAAYAAVLVVFVGTSNSAT